MECLSSIGTGIVGKFAELIVEPVGRQVGYVIHFSSNLQKLEARVEKLKADKQSISNEVDEAQQKGEKIQPNVDSWLKRVDGITIRTDELLKDEMNQAKLKCFLGLCPNPTTRHQLSRNSTKLLLEVIELDENRGFTTVSCGIVRQEVCGISTGEDYCFESRASTLQNIMAELQNPSSKRIGVYGIGGVGKTTLVKQVYKQATEELKKLFDDVVILLDVKSSPDPEAVQKIIVEKLGMKIEDNETKHGRANRLCGRIGSKNVLVILDDLWEKIDLELVGLPNVTTCKILLTSRTKKLLTDMGTDEDFMLDILKKKETWVLFEKKAGDVVKNDAIRAVATQIAECCRGLPVLVVTVASTLKKRTTLPPWRDALRCLKQGYNSEELTESAFLGLEWSYKQLNDEKLKSLFLLCGVTIRGNDIVLEDLLRYSMGMSFFEISCSVEEARDALYSRVEKLKDFCLLIDSDYEDCLRMHDLVRDVASQIAFRDHYMLSSGHVDGDNDEWKEWPHKDFLEKCTSISFPRGNNTLILPEVLQCPSLKMFIFKGNNSMEISPRFFEETKQPSVLALESVHLQSLPSSFQFLKEMQTLCLEQCELEDITLVGELSNLEVLSFFGSKLKHLPQEIAQLTRLRLLDLSYCYQLQVIPHGVLSSLTRLEDLRMNDFYKWETKGEGTNASLLELKELSRLVTLRILIPKPIILPADLFSNCKLERYYVSIGGDMDKYLPYWVDITHNTLSIADDIQLDKGIKLLLKNCEDLDLNGTTFGVKSTHDHPLEAENFRQVKLLNLRGKVDFTYIVQRKIVFPNLTTLKVNRCDRLKYLFTSFMARSLVELKFLEVESCGILEEIVLSTKEDGEENVSNLFTKLESLKLYQLTKLGRFCRSSSYIEFRSLKVLKLAKCYDLESFVSEPMSSEDKDAVEKLNIERKIAKQLKAGEEENRDGSKSKENPDNIENNRTDVRHSLFNVKVAFPSLERLKIEDSKRLSTIWDDQIGHPEESFYRLNDVSVEDCPKLINVFPRSIQGRLAALETIKISECASLQVVFESKDITVGDVEDAHIVETSAPREPFVNCHKLESVYVTRCKSLKYIFSATVARCLQQLRELKVFYCDKLNVIIAGGDDDGALEVPPPRFVFPKVTSLELTRVGGLQSLYPRMHTSRWPSLKQSDIVINFHDKRGFEQESFPQLEHLNLYPCKDKWGPPPPADFFPKLKSISFDGCNPFTEQSTRLFLEELRNQLETIQVQECLDEMLVDDGEIHPATTFHHLTSLKLLWMWNLLHLENPKSRSADTGAADPVFPNLTSLELYDCPKLTSLESSAISFRHLTTLAVELCGHLKYLFSYSVAKSLEQLTKLAVGHCGMLEVIIIATNIDDDDAGKDEIVHLNWRLQSLKLKELPKLQGFVSGNCIVKVPSLVEVDIDECPVNLKVSPDGVLQVTEVSESESVDEEDED